MSLEEDSRKVEEMRARVRALGDEERARVLRRFFKTGPGEYGAGDIFLGACVPDVRPPPRVMLRYAIERLPEAEPRGYLARGRPGRASGFVRGGGMC